MLEENKKVFSKLIDEGFNRGNLAGLDELFTPSFVDHQDGIDPPSLEGLKNFISHARSSFPDLALRVEEMVLVEDKSWSRIAAQGTHEGVFMGLPPTKKCFEITRLDVCRYENGKIAEHWGVVDRLALLQQLGAVIKQPE
jgi:predicted ester cyclase